MIEGIARRLSTLKQFVGFVLAEVTLERGDFQPSIEVLRERSSLAVVRISGEGLRLIVTLVKPSATSPEIKFSSSAPRGEFFRVFDASEVEAFVVAVDDDNSIHRGEHPIVPGFMIIEALLEHERLSACRKLRLRFKRFTSVGQKLYLTFDGENFYVDADERKVEGWTFDD